jgi:regulator of chromosome condensation
MLPVPSLPTQAGLVYVCGNGDCGQLGLGPDTFEKRAPAIPVGLEQVMCCQVAAGGLHSMALSTDGRVRVKTSVRVDY